RTHPADSVLRVELKNAKGISRTEGKAASDAVFAYFRWFGWLDQKSSIPDQIRNALDLDNAFQKNPHKFSDAELTKAVPECVVTHVQISREWLVTLQSKPALWLRARLGQGRELAERLGESWVGDGPLADVLRYEGKEDLFRAPEFH